MTSKTPSPIPSERANGDFAGRRGAALLVVLALIALMTILMVSVFVAASTERSLAQSQMTVAAAAQLAASAPQIVLGQLHQATITDSPWTSQPGLIRTFDPSTGTQNGIYKLYSAAEMVVTGASADNYNEATDSPPADWNTDQNRALYYDLNRPTQSPNTSTSLSYPIVDPAITSSGANPVPGVELTSSVPGYDSAKAAAPDNNPLPMPVRWLYVLKNGDMAVPQSVDGTGNVVFATGDSSSSPTQQNPVVGRIAFWADDETCKVNINTAGYAKNDADYWTYWDTPVQLSKDEMYKLSVAQPWRNEFLRYPGHPATTGLNIVFSNLNLTAEQTVSLTPRYANGGSEGGTITPAAAAGTSGASLPVKTDRLYATVDELFYGTNYAANPRGGDNTVGISTETLEQRRFLLTANSRAPETTLFDTPRVTIWPEPQDPNNRTPLDKLIAFCSTIRTQAFYFVRTTGSSPTDLSIASNVSLFQYLKQLTGRTIPGTGASFQSKYASQPINRDQILTSFIDAIRLSNLYDATAKAAGIDAYTDACPGYVAPIRLTSGPLAGTFAPGRVPTVHEVDVIFSAYGIDEQPFPPPAKPVRRPVSANCMIGYNLYWPAAGPVSPGRNMRIEVSGLQSFKVNGNPIFSSDTWSQTNVDSTLSQSILRLWGGADPVYSISLYGENEKLILPPANTVNVEDFYSLVPPTTAGSKYLSKNFDFTGGTLTIKLYSPATASAPYQTCTLNFPDALGVPPPGLGAFTWTSGNANSRFNENYPNSRVIEPVAYQNETALGVNSVTADYRTLVMKETLTVNDFKKHPDYGLRREGYLGASQSIYVPLRFGRLYPNASHGDLYSQALIPKDVVIQNDYAPGDWDNGTGTLSDGSYSPKTDEGEQTSSKSDWDYSYFYTGKVTPSNQGVFSANRQIPSAAIFGNIPTGTWRTLLFRPARSYHMGGTAHFGATNPPDMYLLDFFHMPVVEPYAISEPFSTAGKVNMNAQVIPFSGYLSRDTALRAVLASTRITAIPDLGNAAKSYATVLSHADPYTTQTRYPLNIEQTLLGFKDRYSGADGSGRRVFLTGAEICGIDLVPDTITSRSNLSSFWTINPATGDNSRERPYAHLLPRLTARSNTFNVHVTAQTLVPGIGQFGWNEAKGRVLAEWRGAMSVERYVDPNDTRFAGSGAPDFLSGTVSVGPYYKSRILWQKRFDR